MDEALAAILEAEREIGGRLSQAREQAEKMRQDATTRAAVEYEKAYDSAKRELEAKIDESLRNAEATASKESARIVAEARAEVENLRKLAQRNMSRAVDAAFKAVVSMKD